MEAQHDHVPSPGNAYSAHGSEVPPMRMPHMEFVYRIVADMDSEGISEIPGVDGTSVSRIVLPIHGGSVSGPRIQGIIVEKSGADWAQVVNPQKASVELLWGLGKQEIPANMSQDLLATQRKLHAANRRWLLHPRPGHGHLPHWAWGRE